MWTKRGKIFESNRLWDWNKSHSQVPTPIVLENKIRVYYSSRDIKNLSRISFVDLDKFNPSKILYEHDNYVLDIGLPGTFDDCGVMPSCVVQRKNQLFLYYIGWNIRNTVPYYNSVGLAISNDQGLTFQKYADGPLWDRNVHEPYFSASTFVMNFNSLWHCYYLSCTEYREINQKLEPRYHIKHAISNDGIYWERDGEIAIDYLDENEAGIVKASVLNQDGMFKMWYSYRKFQNYRTDRKNSYKIGYAESKDGIDWTRKDDLVGIALANEGWDSIMMAYPHVINCGDKLVMFYNGNEFGRDGFGYAEKEVLTSD